MRRAHLFFTILAIVEAAMVFPMAEIEPSARETIDAVQRTVRDRAGVSGPTMVVLVPNSPEEVLNRIKKFADDIEAFKQ